MLRLIVFLELRQNSFISTETFVIKTSNMRCGDWLDRCEACDCASEIQANYVILLSLSPKLGTWRKAWPVTSRLL